jgi:hypothetical protein
VEWIGRLAFRWFSQSMVVRFAFPEIGTCGGILVVGLREGLIRGLWIAVHKPERHATGVCQKRAA